MQIEIETNLGEKLGKLKSYFTDLKFMQWETVIGLEVHIQLALQSKLFALDNAAFGGEPNTHISTVTSAHPGALPVLNSKAFEFAVMMGLACNSDITTENYFDRKHYFYADLPKGYQVTQNTTPVCGRGKITVRLTDGSPLEIAIHHIHLEEDAGKSIHDAEDKYSLIDLNRAGVALLEMVTEPVISSSEEAYAFLAAVRKIVRYIGISDGNMEEGSLRCDANISLRKKGTEKLGVKTEIKNLNSMRYLQKALQFEINRQQKILDAGGEIIQETRGFNSNDGTTFSMREKESSHDYRYFPEPDVPPFILSNDYIYNVKKSMPVLPEQYLNKFTGEFGIALQDAITLTENHGTAIFFDSVSQNYSSYKTTCNWILGPLRSLMNSDNEAVEKPAVSVAAFIKLLQMVDSGVISYSAASQKVLPAIYKNEDADPEKIAVDMNVMMEKDDNATLNLVKEVLASMPDKVSEFRKGKKALLTLFIGEAMKKGKGKHNPAVIKSLIEKELE
ncbi:MAG: Asp-tRNA(Asn)/Glu-tRNA(Gln) amidotransferase subunit GatB [Bacteroidota bacterium]